MQSCLLAEAVALGRFSARLLPFPELMEYLERAVELGGDAIEFEYDEGREWIYVFKNNTSFSIAPLDRREFRLLYDEIQHLKKKKQATISGTAYRLVYSQYDSFGEWSIGLQSKK